VEHILRAAEIQKNYGPELVLKGISLEIEANTFTAILGPSGSGKSTLLNTLSGLSKPSSGQIYWRDTEVTGLSEPKLADLKQNCAGNVFQNYLLLNNLTVEENIKIGIPRKKESISFDRLVGILEIRDILKKFPAQLSGGQQQRAAIARAVIKCPDLLFCDEATGALDETNSKKVVSLLHGLKKTFGITILFTTHNRQIAETADRVLTMKDGLLHGDVKNDKPILPEKMVWGDEL